MTWMPENKYLWDFWFVRSPAGDLHLFYLQATRRECSYNASNRHDLAAIGHAVMTSLGWRELAAAQHAFAKNPDPNTWDSLSIWTGSIIYNQQDQLFYLFYTARDRRSPLIWTPHERQRSQQIGLATSPDLHHWQRLGNTPILPNPGSDSEFSSSKFDGVAWRDPYLVQWHGRFYAFICTRLRDRLTGGGAIAYLTSNSLQSWQAEPQILVQSDHFYQMEVPQVFWRVDPERQTKRLYLLFSAQEIDISQARYNTMPESECQTGTYYLYSEPVAIANPDLPPLNQPARLLAANLYAGKLLEPETTKYPYFFGFPWRDEASQFFGGLSDPQQVEFAADGKIRFC
jgi:beta-fructofuranosidase